MADLVSLAEQALRGSSDHYLEAGYAWRTFLWIVRTGFDLNHYEPYLRYHLELELGPLTPESEQEIVKGLRLLAQHELRLLNPDVPGEWAFRQGDRRVMISNPIASQAAEPDVEEALIMVRDYIEHARAWLPRAFQALLREQWQERGVESQGDDLFDFGWIRAEFIFATSDAEPRWSAQFCQHVAALVQHSYWAQARADISL